MVIKKAEFVTSAVKLEQFPNDNKFEYMFCGRSNVGKSSFINALVNRKNLAKTSQKPGKTQTLNIFNINDELYFVDVPGYGYAKVSKTQREEFGKMIENYVVNRKQLNTAFLLVDFRHEPTEDDVLMYGFLKHYNINVIIIATKADKVSKNQAFKHMKLIKNKLKLDNDTKIILTSSETKQGLEEVLNVFDI